MARVTRCSATVHSIRVWSWRGELNGRPVHRASLTPGRSARQIAANGTKLYVRAGGSGPIGISFPLIARWVHPCGRRD
jgi:hypothetical protein